MARACCCARQALPRWRGGGTVRPQPDQRRRDPPGLQYQRRPAGEPGPLAARDQQREGAQPVSVAAAGNRPGARCQLGHHGLHRPAGARRRFVDHHHRGRLPAGGRRAGQRGVQLHRPGLLPHAADADTARSRRDRPGRRPRRARGRDQRSHGQEVLAGTRGTGQSRPLLGRAVDARGRRGRQHEQKELNAWDSPYFYVPMLPFPAETSSSAPPGC